MPFQIGTVGKTIILSLISLIVLIIPAIPIYVFSIIIDQHKILYTIFAKFSILFSGILVLVFIHETSIHIGLGRKILLCTKYFFITTIICVIFFVVFSLFNGGEWKVWSFVRVKTHLTFLVFYCLLPTIFVGFGEEVVFRKFLMLRLAEIISFKWAIIISSALFAIVHPWVFPTILTMFVAGCLLSIIYLKTNSLATSIGIHSAWNFCQRFIFPETENSIFNHGRIIELKLTNLNYYNCIELSLFVTALFISISLFHKWHKKQLKTV